MRGRGRGKGRSSTSHPHPQRALNLSKKFQLKSMGERERERRGRTLTCLLSKCEKMGREMRRKRSPLCFCQPKRPSTHTATHQRAGATATTYPRVASDRWRKVDLSCMRISHTETGIALVGLVACVACCGTHTNQLYKNFSFTRENCRDEVSV